MRFIPAGFIFAVACSAQGLPPRATPADYQSHAAAGTVTIAAEFAGHSVPTPEGPLTNDDFVVVEAALFGASGEKLTLSPGDFSLRINGSKKPTPSQPYGLVIESLKDPEWAPPEKHDKPKTSFGGGGQSGSNEPPAPVKIPIEVQRAMAQRVKKASLPEGERPLPQAGLIFFPYRGKEQGFHSVELIYSGPAGNATLELHP